MEPSNRKRDRESLGDDAYKRIRMDEFDPWHQRPQTIFDDPLVAAFEIGNWLADATPDITTPEHVSKCAKHLVTAMTCPGVGKRASEMCSFALCNAVGTKMMPVTDVIRVCQQAGFWAARKPTAICRDEADTIVNVMAAIGQAVPDVAASEAFATNPFVLIEPAFVLLHREFAPDVQDDIIVASLQAIVLWWTNDHERRCTIDPEKIFSAAAVQFPALYQQVVATGEGTFTHRAILHYKAVDTLERLFEWAERSASANAKMLLAAHAVSLIFDGSTMTLEIACRRRVLYMLTTLIRCRVSPTLTHRVIQDMIGNLIEYATEARDKVFVHLVEECGVWALVTDMVIDLAATSGVVIEELSNLLFFIECGMALVEGIRERVAANARLEGALAVLQSKQTDADVVGRVGGILEGLCLAD